MPTSQIRWGVGFENVLTFAYPLMSVITDRPPRESSEWIRGDSGVEDAWLTGADYEMRCDARWIPDGGSSPSPMSGATGWQGFLDYARSKQTFRFVPDQTNPLFYVDGCYLGDPMRGAGDLTPDIKRSIPLVLRNPTMDFHLALRGLMFDYTPGADISAFGMNGTFSRASVAARFGIDGLIATEAAAVLRDRHYDGSPTLRGALIEASRTNSCLQSQALATTPWVTNLLTAVNNQSGTAAPDGTITATYLSPTAVSSNDHNDISGTVTITAGEFCAGSGLIKANGYFGARITIADTARANFYGLILDTGSGSVLGSNVGGTGVLSGSRVRALSGGWFYVEFWGKIGGAGTALHIEVQVYDTAAHAQTATAFTGNGSSGQWGWGFQIERLGTASAAPPSSYIPTTTTTATRNADSLSFPWPHRPQAMWLYGKAVHLGHDSSVRGFVHVGAQGIAAPGIFDVNWSGTFYRVTFGDSTSGFIEATLAIAPAIGDTVELLALLFADGHVELHQSINGASETVATNATTKALPSSWSAQTIFVGVRDAGSEAFDAFTEIRAGDGTTVNTMSLARAA